MAATPAFASTPRIAGALVVTANTGHDGTGTLATLITGVAAGTKIERIVTTAMGTTVPQPAASKLNFFLYDGSTYYLYDSWVLTNTAASATAAGYREERAYADLILPSAAWSLKCGLTVAMTAGVGMMTTCYGADLT